MSIDHNQPEDLDSLADQELVNPFWDGHFEDELPEADF